MRDTPRFLWTDFLLAPEDTLASSQAISNYVPFLPHTNTLQLQPGKSPRYGR